MDEPGFAAVVVASPAPVGRPDYRDVFVNAGDFRRGERGCWARADGAHYRWSDLIDPVLLREGIDK